MKRKLQYCLLAILLITTSCDKWLDVKPGDQATTDELFSTYSGFCDALNGCYIKLKERDIYGEKLTMSNIESMAQLWITSQSVLPADYELANFKYDGDNAKGATRSIYSALYNTIAQANMILKNLDKYGSVIKDPVSRALIEGESYAIRAFCHFDVLRLFGQVPVNSTINVSLPYAEFVSSSILPKYYNYSQFVSKIEEDLKKAENLLNNNDPIFKYTFSYLNTFNASQLDDIKLYDEFHGYRQNRFNYWAVKALQARFYLYIGDKEKAYSIAKSIIEAKGVDGNDLIALSGSSDITAGYLACPTESLMMLNDFSIMNYTPDVLGAGSIQIRPTHRVISQDQLNKLFEGQNTASNNRFNQVWDRTLMDPGGIIYPNLKKYFYNKSSSLSSYLNITKRQIIPLIRLSEIYLIAIETTNNLNEANTLWVKYQLSHNVLITENVFTDLNQVKSQIINEYRREFYGEGQMFFTYKRVGSTSMLWKTGTVNEINYIVPLPVTEFNPNK